jgi:hypothetical protein
MPKSWSIRVEEAGSVDELDALLKEYKDQGGPGADPEYKENVTRAIDNATAAGKLDVLEWWKNSAIELHYSQHGMIMACLNGRTQSLDWWKNSGLDPKWTKNYILFGCSNTPFPQVQEWFKANGYL